MDTITAIKSRRAVKQYDPDFAIPAKDEQALLELFRQSPTSFNLQNWRIVNVKDKNLREKIKQAAWGQEHVTNASLLLILCGDTQAWNKNPERSWHNAVPETQSAVAAKIKAFYENDPQKQRDEAIRSVGIGAQTLMLAAKSMGYDTCPMIGFNSEEVGKIINLPKDHVVGMMLAIGKAAQPAWPKPGYLPEEEIFFTDKFPTQD
jgi:nitroreductase